MKALMDEIDWKILKLMQEEGRISNAELARRIGISPPSTLERVRKLEQQGVITGYAALADPRRLGYTCVSFVEVTLGRHGREGVEKFVAEISGIDEVLECHHITGDADFLLKVMTADIPAYEDFVLRKLTALGNVQHLKTLVVLSTMKRCVVLPQPPKMEE